MRNQENGLPSRVRGRDLMGMGSNTCKYKSLRSRAGVRERFYDPAIASDVDAAVDEAMRQTGGDARYRRAWCHYCLHIGVNTFIDQLDCVLAAARQGELRNPASAFHARIRRMKDQMDEAGKKVEKVGGGGEVGGGRRLRLTVEGESSLTRQECRVSFAEGGWR